MTAIIDYDIRNISAVADTLLRIGTRRSILAQPDEVEQVEHINLPTNGSFNACVQNLLPIGWIPTLRRKVLGQGTPLLGICVDTEVTEERQRGLGWLETQVRRLLRSGIERVIISMSLDGMMAGYDAQLIRLMPQRMNGPSRGLRWCRRKRCREYVSVSRQAPIGAY